MRWFCLQIQAELASNYSTPDPLFSHNNLASLGFFAPHFKGIRSDQIRRWPGRKGTPSRPKWTSDKRPNLGRSSIYHETSRTQLKLEVVGSAGVLCVVCAVCCCVLCVVCAVCLLCIVSVVCCVVFVVKHTIKGQH